MKKAKATKKTLIKKDGHQLFNIKKMLDQVLSEADSIGKEVRNAIVQARNTAWTEFVKEQERIHTTTQN